jgi:hypothetical protein
MSRWRFAMTAVLVTSSFSWPFPAEACRASAFHRALIHNALPTPLPEGTFIAAVEFDAHSLATSPLHPIGVRARIIRVIQGEYRGRALIVRKPSWGSCDHPFQNGAVGFIVGRPVGYEQGLLVVHPIEVPAHSGFRLPDGFQLPAE